MLHVNVMRLWWRASINVRNIKQSNNNAKGSFIKWFDHLYNIYVFCTDITLVYNVFIGHNYKKWFFESILEEFWREFRECWFCLENDHYILPKWLKEKRSFCQVSWILYSSGECVVIIQGHMVLGGSLLSIGFFGQRDRSTNVEDSWV